MTKEVPSRGTCADPDCTRWVCARGLCSKHYRIYMTAGKIQKINCSTEERFWAKVQKSSGCWLWTAGDNGRDYGRFNSGSGSVYVHRYAYTLLVGQIPDGMTIDHLCRVRRCVRPDHLEVVTLAENIRRAIPARKARFVPKTTCREGHAKKPNSEGEWFCPECSRRTSREHSLRLKARKRAAAVEQGTPGMAPHSSAGASTTPAASPWNPPRVGESAQSRAALDSIDTPETPARRGEAA